VADAAEQFESASEDDLSDDGMGGDGGAVKSVLSAKVAKLSKWHVQLKERCESLRAQLKKGQRDIPGVAELQGEAAEVETTADDLLDACEAYMSQLAKHQVRVRASRVRLRACVRA
jgi:hypothetical protein